MYNHARTEYQHWGVDTEDALTRCAAIPLSLHCWQGDDVTGFENPGGALSGGIQTTGNYPGKARGKDDLFKDLDFTYSLIPGKKRLNLHAIYGIGDAPVKRDELDIVHFEPWLAWTRARGIGIDFNPTLFSHPLASEGLTLSHPDRKVRDFWIRHVKATRKIAAYLG